MKNFFFFGAFVIIFLSACQPSKSHQKLPETPTPTSTFTPQATNTLTPTPTATQTPIPTSTPTITPTPLGGGNGTILYTEGWTLYSINTNGKNKKLIDDNCSWNMTFSPDGHFMTCSKYQDIDKNSFGGLGVKLIDLSTHKVASQFAETTVIGSPSFKNGFSFYNYIGSDFPLYGWSPNSKLFAFTGTYRGESGLFIINIVDSSIKLIYKSSDLDVLKWSPTGNKILFFEHVKTKILYSLQQNVYVINTTGENLLKITQNPEDLSFERYGWGKDGDDTIYHKDTGIDLNTLKPNGKTIKYIYSGTNVVISPDQRFQVTTDFKRHQIILESVDGSKKTDISKKFPFSMSHGVNIQWSPDNKTLSYYNPFDMTIVLMPIDTLNVTRLVKVNRDKKNQWADYFYGDYLWLPDGKHIIFIQADGTGGFAICITDLSGNITTLTTAKYPVEMHIEPTK